MYLDLSSAEECDCVCRRRDGPCCCHGPPTAKTQDFEEFDGIDDILAVSHLSEKSSMEKKIPLLRAKTLPAIITPSLSIVQAPLESKSRSKIPTIIQTEANGHSKVSPGKSRSKRSPSGSSTRRNSEKWQLLVDDDSSSAKSPGNSPRNSFSSTGSCNSQASSSKDKSEHGSNQSSKVGLAKLARLLTTPREKSTSTDRPSSHGSDSSLAPDAASLRKANSIDSLLESSSSGYNLDVGIPSGGDVSPVTPSPGSGGKTLPASPSVPAKLESHKRANGTTTSPNKQSKESRQSSLERIIDAGLLTKTEKKKLEKVNKFNIDLQAFFSAVEHGQLERARSLLHSSDIDINSVNGDGFTPLDLAVMTTNVAMVQLLQSHGATESPTFSCKESRASHLQNLVREAGRCVEDLGTCVLSAATNGSLSAALLKEKERQLSLWQRRHHLLKRMKTGFDHLCVPDPPSAVQLEVVGTRSLRVKFSEPQSSRDANTLVTKYKVEWSCYEDFSILAGSREITDVHKLEITIPDLTQGSSYFVRVSAGNVKGYSSWKCASPPSATPSSWRDVEEKSPRWTGHPGKLDDLFHQIINSRSMHAGEIKDLSDTPQQQRKQVRKSIKHLFTSAPKFQKNMKRGVFLACLLYNEEKILVTAEDTLPILEVDEAYPSSLHTDFHWLMKVACTWEDVKTLRLDMEKSHSSSNIHFRTKLLQAAEQMQSALGLQDLGQLYYLPLKDSEGTTVLCTVKHIRDPKTLVTLSVRWMPLHKIQRKRSNNSDNNSENPAISDLLLDSLQELIYYSQVSNKPLSRGLYVGYLKLQSSVDVIRLVVPKKTPNVLPHVKIRDNPHVSCDEWSWFKSLVQREETPKEPSEIQSKFQKSLSSATKHLLNELDISQDLADEHRYYDSEVIELSEDVSFLLVLPPVDSVCSVPGQCDEITTKMECIPLPIQIFETIHMVTYQWGFISRYSRLSSILEMETMLANHAQREAFSPSEVSEAKGRLSQLQELQSQADETWRSARWITDVLSFARDKQGSNGVSLRSVCQAPVPTSLPLRRCSSASRLQDSWQRPAMGGRALSEADLLRPPRSVIRVWAAYETGLPNGTSVRLHVTPLTTAREVVDLVVRQLNMAVVLKGRGGPVYGSGAAFKLVAALGPRERTLSDDFRPIKLQKGKLLVRKKE